MLAIVIPVLDSFYNKVAFWLNDMGESCIFYFSYIHQNMRLIKIHSMHTILQWFPLLIILMLKMFFNEKFTENYKLEETYEDHLVVKLILVREIHFCYLYLIIYLLFDSFDL